MSKKTIAMLSLSLLALAACSAPAEVIEDTEPTDEVPVIDEVLLDDTLTEEAVTEGTGAVVEQEVPVTGETVVDPTAEVPVDGTITE